MGTSSSNKLKNQLLQLEMQLSWKTALGSVLLTLFCITVKYDESVQ